VSTSFGKEYKLCSKLLIDELFEHGEQLKCYPFFVRYKVSELDEDVPFQVVFSAPKKKFKRAHERSRIKRISREAFRLNKAEFELYLKSQNKQLALFVVYTAPAEISFDELNKSVRKMQKKLTEILTKNEVSN